MVIEAKAAFELHIPNKPFLVCKYEHLSLLAPLSLVSGNCHQYGPETSWIPCALYVAPPADVRVIQVTHEVKSLQMCGFFQLSEEGLICFFLLNKQSVANTHHSISHIDLLSKSDPSALRCLITCPKAELYAVLLLSHTKGNLPSPPSRPVLPKQPVAIHSSTPVV